MFYFADETQLSPLSSMPEVEELLCPGTGFSFTGTCRQKVGRAGRILEGSETDCAVYKLLEDLGQAEERSSLQKMQPFRSAM